MKSILVIVSLFALGFTLVNGVAITARSPFSGCGEGRKVLASNNFEHDGNTIGFVSSTCPQARGASKAKRDVLEERQNICTDGTCTITCENDSKTTIIPDDCATVIAYLAVQSGTVSVPAGPGSYHAWYSGTCAIYFVNADTVPYTACYETIAFDSLAAGTACVGITNGAICAGSGASGQLFAIVIGGNDTASAF